MFVKNIFPVVWLYNSQAPLTDTTMPEIIGVVANKVITTERGTTFFRFLKTIPWSLHKHFKGQVLPISTDTEEQPLKLPLGWSRASSGGSLELSQEQ